MKRLILVLLALLFLTTTALAAGGARIYGSTADMTTAPILGATSCVANNDPADCCTGSGAGTCTALEDGDISFVGSPTQGFFVYIYDIDGTDADNGVIGLRPDDYVSGGYWDITTAFTVNGTITLGGGGDEADDGTALNLINGATFCWEDATEDCITHVDNTGFSVNRNFAAATYGSDGSVSDAELLAVDDGTTVALAGLTIADVSVIEGTGADAVAMVASGGNNYFFGSNSDNTALEFKTPANALTAIGIVPVAATINAIDDGATTEILVGGGAGVVPVWTAATGTGAPMRGTSPQVTTGLELNHASENTLTAASGVLSIEGNVVHMAGGADIADDDIADDITASSYLPLAGGALTAEVTVDELGFEFQEVDNVSLTDCSLFSATGGGIFYDDSENKFKKCMEGALSDLDTAGGGTTMADDALWAAVGDIPYATGNDAGAVLSAGDEGTLLMGNGAAAPSFLAAGATTTILVGGGAADPVWTTAEGTGAPVRAVTPTLTTPVIGAATGTSLIVTGILDGLTNVVIATDGTESANGTGAMSQVIINKHATANTALAVTLAATPIAGMQLLVKNGKGAGGVNTGVITLATGGSIIIWNPTTKDDCAAGENLVSGGAAGDMVGVMGIDSTHYDTFGSVGTWACN